MSHGAGIYAIPHLMAGARHVVPASGGVDPAELFALAQRRGRCRCSPRPPSSSGWWTMPSAGRKQRRSFKTIVYGGAPMYAADIQRALSVMGPRFVQIYGQGETPMVGTALSRAHLADRCPPAPRRSASPRSAWRRRRCKCA
jgi:long-chain acyl-CoA synthetase